MKRLIRMAGTLAASFLLLTGCEQSGNWGKFPHLDYLPVQFEEGESWSIVDKNGKVIVREEYDPESAFSEIKDGVFWVLNNGVYQLFSVSQPKKPLTSEEFSRVTPFYAGRAVVANPNKPIRIIDTKGNTVATLPKDITRCYRFSDDGYAVFEDENGHQGLLNTSGQKVLMTKYVNMEPVTEGLVFAMAPETGNWVIMDVKGRKLGQFDYEEWSFREGKIVAGNFSSEDSPYIVLDKTGKKLFEVKKSMARWGDGYLSGYLCFCNTDGKYGVVDDKGEVVIRAKYDRLVNLGSGEFGASKGGKDGVVNAKDETILDFDYSYVYYQKFGNNYLVRDGSSFLLVDKNGKKLSDFENFHRMWAGHEHVEYFDVASVAASLVKLIEDCERPISSKSIAEKKGQTPEDYRNKRYVEDDVQIKRNVSVNLAFWYNSPVAEEKTHTEMVNDGWFTTQKTVSDGYRWADPQPKSVIGTLHLSDVSNVDMEALYASVFELLKKGRTDTHKKKGSESERYFSKEIKQNGLTTEIRTKLTKGSDHLRVEIEYVFK